MKKKITIRCRGLFLVLGFWLGALHAGIAQHYELQYFNQEDRLSARSNGTMLEDEQGYLWTSSFRGLTRFDGRNFMTFHSGSNADVRVGFEDIGSLYKLNNGAFVYLQSRADIGLFDPKTFQVRSISFADLLPGNPIIVSINEQGGNVYICLESSAGIAAIKYDGLEMSIILRQEMLRTDAIDMRSESRPKLFIVPYAEEEYLFFDINQGYFFYDQQKHLFTPIVLPLNFADQEQWPYFMFKDESLGWLLSFTDTKGLFTFDSKRRVVLHSGFDKEIVYKNYAKDAAGNLMFSGSKDGIHALYLYKKKERSLSVVSNSSHSAPYFFCLWSKDFTKYFFKTGPEGLVYGQQPAYEITPYLALARKDELGVGMRSMLKLENGLILLGTDRHGLYLFDPIKESTVEVKTPSHWPQELKPVTYSRSFLKDTAGYVWLTAYAQAKATERPGGYLIKFHEETLELTSYTRLPSRVQSMAFVNDTVILAGIESELSLIKLKPRIEAETLRFPEAHWPPGITITRIIPAQQKGFFFVLTNTGLFYYDSEQSTIRLLPTSGALVRYFLYLYQEDENTLWLGTYGDGLYKYDFYSQRVEAFGYNQGIKSDMICGILPQGEDHLLLSTYNGLYRFDKRTGLASNHGLEHGWMHFEFNQYGTLGLTDTSWLFGGVNGFHQVKQITRQEENQKLRILLSFVRMSNEKNDSDTTFYSSAKLLNGIKLPAGDRRLQVGFSWFEPEQMGSVRPYFRLYPLSEQWELLPENGELNFSLIPAGHHELQVTFNRDEPPVFKLPILAEWLFFERRDFQLLAGLVVLGILSLLSYLFFDRKLIRVKTTQLEENEAFRKRLFAYISHEFKTPLTIIFGLVNRLRKQLNEQDFAEDLALIERHGTLMANLVNQMIELNELASDDWQPNYVQVILQEELEELIKQLQPLADSFSIALTLTSADEVMQQWTDLEMLKVIVNNLVSNAIKFSPHGATVKMVLTANLQEWSLTVQDQGPGIKEKEIGQIFDLFYHSNQQHDKELPSSGIGLAYVKAAVEAMGGRIEVSNQGGSVFKVILPVYDGIEKELLAANEMNTSDKVHAPSLERQAVVEDDRLLMLMVEDTPDMAKYIAKCFSPEKYHIIWARDGEEGIQKAVELVPDIIVSDVRMPRKSGFELCDYLKHHPATNHIPIVLLTALSDQASKLEGLEARADIYLFKPFREEELVLTVNNLMYTREKIQAYYAAKHLELDPEENSAPPVNRQQEEFLQELDRVLSSYYTDPLFGVAEMSTKLFLSRAQLHRKVKAVLGRTPSDALRQFRLEKAKKLVETESDTIAQIALRCGFNDPSYFTKVFTNTYGSSPSKYQKGDPE